MENVVNDTQGAVVAPEKQTRAENSGFKKMRLENEQYRNEIEGLKSEIAELSKLKEVQKQSDIYLKKLIDDKMARDLKEIQKSDPSVESLDMLGEDFIRLVENGIDAAHAYFALKAAKENAKTKAPPTLSPMNSALDRQNTYYTSRELDRLSARDLENPAIFKKAMQSLKKL